MTRSEFDAIVFLLDNAFKGGLTEDQQEAYWALLGRYEKAQVLSALDVLAANGSPFVPSVPEIVQAMDAGAPVFDEAWPKVLKALRSSPVVDVSSSGAPVFDDHATLASVRASAGPLIAGWCAMYGLSRLREEPSDDPQYGGAVLHRLRESFAEMTASPAARERLALAEYRAGQLKRVDAAALLGVGEGS